MGTLTVVATPIGNLEDITLRAVSVLTNADFICAEDTRVTHVLLERYHIVPRHLITYHQHSTLRTIEEIIARLERGEKGALVSDAGTPGVNDPGSYLISKILEALPDAKIMPIPGPNAAIAALSVSGFPADTFTYLGFPPHKKGRQTFFKDIGQMPGTIVFYESKHRIGKALKELENIARIGDRPVMVARELTKQFETIYRGTIGEVALHVAAREPLGEFVVVLGPKPRKKSHEE